MPLQSLLVLVALASRLRIHCDEGHNIDLQARVKLMILGLHPEQSRSHSKRNQKLSRPNLTKALAEIVSYH